MRLNEHREKSYEELSKIDSIIFYIIYSFVSLFYDTFMFIKLIYLEVILFCIMTLTSNILL